MQVWEQRPREYAALLNPAFCAILLHTAIDEYYIKAEQGLSYPLAILVLPIVLHKSTRTLLPSTTRTNMETWLQKNPSVHINFAQRVQHLVPYTQEALIFAMQTNILAVNDTGRFVPEIRRIAIPSSWTKESEPYECQQGARIIGRWFHQIGEVNTIFELWGIRP